MLKTLWRGHGTIGRRSADASRRGVEIAAAFVALLTDTGLVRFASAQG